MPKHCIVILFHLLVFSGYGQTINYNGKLIDSEGNPVDRVRLELLCKYFNSVRFENLPSYECFTDDNGAFVYPIQKSIIDKIEYFQLSILNTDYNFKNIENSIKEKKIFDEKGELKETVFICFKRIDHLDEYKKANQKVLELNGIIQSLNDSIKILHAVDIYSNNIYNDLNKKIVLMENELETTLITLSQLKNEVEREMITVISSYLDDLRNLDQFIDPQNIKDAFIYDEKRMRLEELLTRYNSSRANLVKSHEIFLNNTKTGWGEKLKAMLDTIFQLALKDINQGVLVNQFNVEVLDRLDSFTKQEKPRILMQPKAVKATRTISYTLGVKVNDLVKEVENFRNELIYN